MKSTLFFLAIATSSLSAEAQSDMDYQARFLLHRSVHDGVNWTAWAIVPDATNTHSKDGESMSEKHKTIGAFVFMLAVLWLYHTTWREIITSAHLPTTPATNPAREDPYALDSKGEKEIGQVVVDPVPLPVSATGLALSLVGVKVVGAGWTTYREPIVSSIDPPRIGSWVQCLPHYEYYRGFLGATNRTTLCKAAEE